MQGMSKSPRPVSCPPHWTAAQRLARHTKVDPQSGCHIWQASTLLNGYGQLTFRRQKFMAHRLAWIARHGPIPKGLHVCHRCDERRCCNPDQMFLGTHAENMADLRIKRRARRRVPLEPFPDEIRAADLKPIRIFIGGLEYVGKAVARAFDPYRPRAQSRRAGFVRARR